MEEEMITIPRKEYDELLKRDLFLTCLDGCGVDNWDGYGDAYQMFEEYNEDK